MREVTELAKEASSLLGECQETIDDYVAFAMSCSTDEQIEEGTNWANNAIDIIIENLGETDMSAAGIAVLLNRIHSAGLTLLEHNFKAMVQEKFVETMA